MAAPSREACRFGGGVFMIGILGGTFDPVHHGHLRLAMELYERLALNRVWLLPAARPPHREAPRASPEDRLAMLRAAVGDTPELKADDRELRRPGPSYMVETLEDARREIGGETPICLLLGMDAFTSLASWHRWRELVELAHLVVVRRPNTRQPLDDTMRHFLEQHQLKQIEALRDAPGGGILMRDIPALMISATEIRDMLATGRNPRYLLPDAVLDFILERQLYRHGA